MSEMKPEIRFERFEDEWKNLKIDEVGTITAGGDIDKSQLSEKGKYPVIANAITNKGIVGYYDTFTINTPAVTITGRGDIGFAFARDKNFTPVVRLLVIEPKEKINHYFLANSINNLNIFHESTGVPQLTSPQISRLEITVPGYNEQKYIGTFFKKIENTIENKQTKFKKMKQFKQAMLQKIFPKEGETVPEIRFEGFYNEWFDYKLSDTAHIIGGGTPSTTIKKYWDGEINWYSPNEIDTSRNVYNSNKKITNLGLSKSSAKILPANKTILFTSRATIGEMAILKTPGSTNQGFQSLIVKDQFNVDFIYSMGFKIKKSALELSSGSTFKEISGKKLEKINILVPSLREQKLIGDYFYKLDQLIENKQKELDKLNQFKQAMLDKMFV